MLPKGIRRSAYPLLGNICLDLITVLAATMSTIEDDPKVFQGTPNEDARLENLGYEQGQSTPDSSRCKLPNRPLMCYCRAQEIFWSN
jgi:hypothetical protein